MWNRVSVLTGRTFSSETLPQFIKKKLFSSFHFLKSIHAEHLSVLIWEEYLKYRSKLKEYKHLYRLTPNIPTTQTQRERKQCGQVKAGKGRMTAWQVWDIHYVPCEFIKVLCWDVRGFSDQHQQHNNWILCFNTRKSQISWLIFLFTSDRQLCLTMKLILVFSSNYKDLYYWAHLNMMWFWDP